MSGTDDYPFDVKTLRGKNHDKLIDYVVLAEFDIDTGSTVRHQYPNDIPGYKSDWFAEFMLPEGAHNRDVDYTYIFLNREDQQIDHDYWIKPNHSQLKDAESNTDMKHFLYGINLVKTKHDSSVRRGAIVKAMCVFSRYHYIEAFKKPLDMALEKYFSHPSIDVLQKLFDSMNAIDLSSLPRPNLMEQCLMRRGVHFEQNAVFWCADHLPQSWVHSLSFVLQGNGFEEDTQKEAIPLSIPLYRTPDEVGDISVTSLVRTFGDSVMQIFHSILMRQRVLFVGYNHAAGDVAQMVLSAVAMVAPPLTNIIRRTYPYANLSDLTFLEVKGYVAGVTNPMFQQRDSWWDLLCVLDLPNGTGTIQSAEEKRGEDGPRGGSNHGGSATSSSGGSKLSAHNSRSNLASYEDSSHYSADYRFISGVLSGINARLGEDWVRQQFYDYMSCIANHTQDRSVLSHNQKVGDDKSRKFVEANSLRVAALHSNVEFRAVPHHPWAWCGEHSEDGDSNSRALMHKRTDSDMSLLGGSPVPGSSPATVSSTGGGGGGGIAFHREDPEEATTNTSTNTSESLEVSTSLPDDSLAASLVSSPTPSSPIPTDLNAIANTAASLFAPPRRKASERHKDSGTLMKMYVRKLQYEVGQESVSETQRYFQHLQKHLQSEGSLQALLVLLPESVGGLSCIATGLFHSSPRVRYCATQILTKVQEFRSTLCAFHALNKMFISAYDRQLVKVNSGALLREIEEVVEPATPEVVTPTKASSEKAPSLLPPPVVVPPQTFEEMLDPTNLSNLLQSTLDGLLNTPDNGSVGDFHYAFSNTIDELDLIP